MAIKELLVLLILWIQPTNIVKKKKANDKTVTTMKVLPRGFKDY